MLKRVFSLMTVVLMVCSLMIPIMVFADDIEALSKGQEGISKIEYPENELKVETMINAMGGDTSTGWVDKDMGFTTDGILYVKHRGDYVSLLQMKNGELLVNENGYEEANTDKVTTATKKFVDALTDVCDEKSETADEIMTEFQNIGGKVNTVMLALVFDDTKGDMYGAYTWLSPAFAVLNIVLGIGAVILIFLLLASTVLDLAYIGLPIWREHSSENGKDKPFGVSFDATATVKEVEKNIGEGQYKNAYLIYLKRRAITYIILAVCIMYLICGGLSGIINGILGLVSGITG